MLCFYLFSYIIYVRKHSQQVIFWYPLYPVSFTSGILFQLFFFSPLILIWQRNSACNPTKKLQSTKPENFLITTDNYKALTLETPDKMYKLCRLFFYRNDNIKMGLLIKPEILTNQI